MNIVKAAPAQTLKATGEEMAAINALTRRELGEEEVYLFSVRLCDNEVDRDGERFAPETLAELSAMFVGKCGIFDHQWSARGQTARIYKCELVREEDKLTRAGDPYCWLKGYAYMLRCEGNRQLMDEIDAGIKKEVSVGCSVAHKVCSICGEEISAHPCEHRKGARYGGQLCYAELRGAVDAYEFSFVAVPAQPMAGVVKGLRAGFADLKQLCAGHPACAKELEQLEQEAALGRLYQKQLREEVVRLGLLAELGLEAKTLREMANAMSPEYLEQLKAAYAARAEKRYPLHTQLEYASRQEENRSRDEAFLI